MPAEKLTEYFESHDVQYKLIEHEPVYTAQETAASARISGKELAKTVMVKVDGKLAMAVLPASQRVNFSAFKDATGASEVLLASEKEFKDAFPDCELGAMPPFGNLYGMQVYVDESLSEELVVAFCAGTHSELVQISFQDFERLAQPVIIKFSWQPE